MQNEFKRVRGWWPKTSRLLLSIYLSLGSRYQLLKRPGLRETRKVARAVTV